MSETKVCEQCGSDNLEYESADDVVSREWVWHMFIICHQCGHVEERGGLISQVPHSSS
jgi:uncharacterized Zn finger protein